MCWLHGCSDSRKQDYLCSAWQYQRNEVHLGVRLRMFDGMVYMCSYTACSKMVPLSMRICYVLCAETMDRM